AIADPDERQKNLAVFLESHGYLYGARSADNILLVQPLFPIETLHRIVISSLRTPSPDLALNAFERLAGVIPAPELVELSQHRKRMAQFVLLCGSSPFLANLIFKAPAAFCWLFLENAIRMARSDEEMLTALSSQVDEATDFSGLMRVLREFKRFEILRIAARDLNGLAPLEEVTAELSSLAAAALQVAYNVCRRCL